MTPDRQQLRRWLVTRTVKEYYSVVAATRKEALDNASDPHKVIIKSEKAELEKLKKEDDK